MLNLYTETAVDVKALQGLQRKEIVIPRSSDTGRYDRSKYSKKQIRNDWPTMTKVMLLSTLRVQVVCSIDRRKHIQDHSHGESLEVKEYWRSTVQTFPGMKTIKKSIQPWFWNFLMVSIREASVFATLNLQIAFTSSF